MKINVKSFLSGVLVTIIVVCLIGSAFANAGLTITVNPSIKILVNGHEFKPADVNGDPVMTFVYKGTTYAPLRALAEAYGLDVGYDDELKLVTVTDKAEADEIYPFEYEIVNGEVTLTSCDKEVTEIIVPEYIDGYPVTTIGDGCFTECEQLTTISLPECIVTIESRAFESCMLLENINFPSSLKNIGPDAFTRCFALETVNLSNTDVETIGMGAFMNCRKLRSVKFPDSLSIIYGYAFSLCKSLEVIEIELNPDMQAIFPTAFDSTLKEVIVLGETFYPDEEGRFKFYGFSFSVNQD